MTHLRTLEDRSGAIQLVMGPSLERSQIARPKQQRSMKNVAMIKGDFESFSAELKTSFHVLQWEDAFGALDTRTTHPSTVSTPS
eukprot:2757669-Amphidinium_carterae.1